MTKSSSFALGPDDKGNGMSFSDKGIWTFVGIDLAIFALFFLVFLIEKKLDPFVFAASRQSLSVSFGFFNMIVLLTSSWLLVRSIKTDDLTPSRRYLAGSILAGCVFMGSKGGEYYGKYLQGISVVENTFFTFYYILTFLHFCHVFAGLIVLTSVYRTSKHHASLSLKSFTESVGIYWHMVDLLWIYLFLILYLL